MTTKDDALAAFIEAASVPLDCYHASGTLEDAQEILAAHPEIAARSIHGAALLGEDALVRRFLELDRAQATRKGGPRGWDALTYLCFSRYLRLDRTRAAGFARAAGDLLDAGASANTGFTTGDHHPPEFESVLYGAAGISHDAVLTRLLVEHGADLNDGEVVYHTPETYDNACLRVLIETGQLSADSLATILLRKHDWHDHDGVALLLGSGADPNRLTPWGYTALHQAIRRDNGVETIALLLDHGADPAVRAYGQSAVAMAAYEGRGDALDLFAERGFSVDLEGVEQLLAACARHNSGEVRSRAKREPAHVRQIQAQGGKLLGEFAGIGNTDGVRHLLDLGVDVNARDAAGDGYWDIAKDSTALHVAAWRARHATLKLLIARGGLVDVVDGEGRTALFLAVRACLDSYWTDRRSPESVAALLDAGASASSVVLPTGYGEVDSLLRQHGQLA